MDDSNRLLTATLVSLCAVIAAAALGEEEARDHIRWPFTSLVEVPVPAVRDAAGLESPIDAFIARRLEAAGIGAAPPAERRTLLRRLTFDLLGLPPEPEEIDAFLADPSPDALDRAIDRLLASPRHGERWGRHWLDVVRYTESQGFEYDRLRENAWHYRDWVIDSLNRDTPYDRFVRQQVAGDVLEPVTAEGIVATSLLVCGPWDQAGSGQANRTQRLITREEEMEDLVSVVAQGFLGVTLNCARCHEHKYDPIPQADYYRVKSVFDGVVHGEREIVPPAEAGARTERVARLEGKIAALEREIAGIEAAARRTAIERNTPAAAPRRDRGPAPLARWTFEDDTARDATGGLHGELHGGATIAGGRLRLDGKGAFLRTAPLARDLREKTLEAWVSLAALDQGGGGAIAIEDSRGGVFDAIVYGERERRKWIAGSSGFARTRDLEAPEETAAPGELVHVAVVYAADSSIALYRNGAPHGAPYTPESPLQTYRAGDARVLLGMRHTGGGRPFLAGEIEEAAIWDRALSAAEVEASFRESGLGVTKEQVTAAMSPAARARRDELAAGIRMLRAELAAMPPPETSYAGTRRQPEPTRVLERGDVTRPGEVIAPGALSAVAQPAADFDMRADAPEAARRVRLARWITDPHNPLTARTIANRVWHHHLGRGIVETPNDLGGAGSGPSHPELLDWLARDLIDGGWSLKRLHRRILGSAAYRRSSAVDAAAAARDADNRLLWRFRPRRLEAEVVRDAMLLASGDLSLAMGGPSFRDFTVSTFGSSFYHLEDAERPEHLRRTVYRMNVISGKHPFLDALDCPDPGAKTPDRRSTTTPIQALALMNDAFVERRARSLARCVAAECRADLRAAIRRAWLHVLGREPTGGELEASLAVARDHDLFTVAWALFNSSEFLHVR